jgi:hypothetical protein
MLPLFETLESREFLSASPIKTTVKTTTKSAKPAVKVAKKVKATVAAVAPAVPVAWNDLAGDWTGTFSNNIGAAGTISSSFQKRQGVSCTGTFNLSALIGQSNLLTTTTPDADGNVLVTIPAKGGIVSLISAISYDGQYWTGRWCTHIGSQFVVGYFQMHRVA